jgi:hypothetical protein
MNIEIDDNIVEGTEFAVYLNGRLIESGVCEYEGQVDDLLGQIDSITNEYTSYTINNISYFDFPNGKTFFVVSSSGITDSMIVSSAITKNEYLLDFVMSPEIQADVFVERGKYSPFESLERLGEVDNTGDMVRYGYGFFKINTI